MTPTRWLIAAFWVFVLVMGAKSFYDYNSRLDHQEAAQAEKHYFPPPLPGAVVETQAPGADVRQVSYIPQASPQNSQFTAQLVIKNFGLKKATDIRVRVQPYVGSVDSSKQQGPDEILNPNTVDQMAGYYQWVEFADLGPGESATKTLIFPMRGDADPREHFDPKVDFETVKDTP